MKNILNNNRFLALFALWVLIHTCLLFSSEADGYKSEFWPFSNKDWDQVYDKSEWLVYCLGPIIILYIYVSFVPTDKRFKFFK